MNTSTLFQSCSDERVLLQKSATFAMSLGAKELFHTNFLAFLLESHDDSLDPVRRALLKALGLEIPHAETSICAVWREKYHMDLIVVPLQCRADQSGISQVFEPSEQVLVIEAKLKSIPTRHQLDHYRERIQSGITVRYPESENPSKTIHLGKQRVPPQLVLLSTQGNRLSDCWRPVTWADISDAIRSSLKEIDNEGNLATILEDYVEALSALLRVINKARNFFETTWTLSQQAPYTSLLDSTLDPGFRRMRLHDLVSKSVFDSWAHKEASQIDQSIITSKSYSFDYYVHFSNSQPGISFELSFPICGTAALKKNQQQRLKVGIQIQGRQFRRTVSVSFPEAGLERFIVINDLGAVWLGTTCFNSEPKGLRGTKRKTGRLTYFYVFDVDHFIYSYVPLEDAPLAQVSNEIGNSLKAAAKVCDTLIERRASF